VGDSWLIDVGRCVKILRFLICRGYTDNAIVHHGVLEKEVKFIQKPFTFDRLARKVREALDK
jgi:hypothetical protein